MMSRPRLAWVVGMEPLSRPLPLCNLRPLRSFKLLLDPPHLIFQEHDFFRKLFQLDSGWQILKRKKSGNSRTWLPNRSGLAMTPTHTFLPRMGTQGPPPSLYPVLTCSGLHFPKDKLQKNKAFLAPKRATD